ncbi:MAG: hypothetical protein M1813_006021 [Trichoglossum hirsutum]|nr:MAG: hypothetical protein M1813_006021 [Trichoglossum hirsutum]
MVVTYSPHRSAAGGTLHFPSPTHVHHPDTAAIRSLRRSLSRSPSKGPAFRLVTSKSPSPTSPLSPSPRSPPPRPSSAGISSSTTYFQSPLAVPFPPSAKITRSANRRLTPMRSASTRSKTAPGSPIKYPLQLSKNNGNTSPPSPRLAVADEENLKSRSASPGEKHKFERQSRGLGVGEAPDDPDMQHFSLSGGEKGVAGSLSGLAATSSPLKRSDGIMNLDQANLGSPLAKRRSLHGVSFGSDFDIFDHSSPSSSHFDSRSDGTGQDSELPGNSNNTACHALPHPVQSMTRRSSSLRKSTLQQRHGEKPNYLRSRPGASDLGFEFSTPGPPTRIRGRVSLDSFMPPVSREGPFLQGSLPSASVHVLSQQSQDLQHGISQPQHQPHPLSRAMTSSSSGSSLGDLLADSPTHAPTHPPVHPRPIIDFTKSLPVGSSRPLFRDSVSREQSTGALSTESSFATPRNYRAVKPHPAAFMSTGLISKRNRNPDDRQMVGAGSKAQMPDTPCKRSTSIFSATPTHVPEVSVAKTGQVHHEFGTPSTPFNPHATRPTPGTFGKGVSVFGSGFAESGISRRGSFISVDGDESSESPSSAVRARAQSLSGSDFDLPPTPTKQPYSTGSTQQGSGRGQKGGLFRQGSSGDESGPRRSGQSCKLSPIGSPLESVSWENDRIMDDSPTPAPATAFLLSPTTTTSALACSRLLRVSRTISPTPVQKKSNILSPLSLLENVGFTKTKGRQTASPLERRDNFEQVSPRTPQENILPPDPSGLSISVQGDRNSNIPVPDGSSSAMMLPPATPTTGREYFAQFQIKRPHITPINGFVSVDMDESLTSRFNKVELIGTGEFSQVYRVTQSQRHFQSRTKVSGTEGSQTPLPDQVFAVKKSRSAYNGTRDRLRKLQEVAILKALGQADHIVQLIDSWEERNHLYVQTEFCEEGSLDLFLAQVGRKARLDDFRIWKILLELSLGVKHIHDSGFIHLDLKPANILITFEGVLKIADFGMATEWPAPAGIEGEGDREYIGPEILMGKFDKPADIFALGLIMLEIAGNVELPDNGPSWQKLRTGDMSDVPSLTWSDGGSTVFRDQSGNPLSRENSFENLYRFDSGEDGFGSPKPLSRHMKDKPVGRNSTSRFDLPYHDEILRAPAFMTDPRNDQALERIVRWMISPNPTDRPVPGQILGTVGVKWVEARRRAGATVFEGNWGPVGETFVDDSEMVDV